MNTDSRSRLIDATRELLWERGYASTSPKDIQARAAVGQGSMYHHFTGKAELASVALAESGDALLASAEESFQKDASAFDRLVDYLRRDRPALRGCPIGRMTEDAEVVASHELRAPVEQTLSTLRSRITELLGEAQATGELQPGLSPDLLAATIVATVQGSYVLAKAANDERPFGDAIEGLVDLLRSQLSVPQNGM